MKDALLLVFANKQDLNGAMRPKEVSDRLQLEKIAKDHVWKVEPSCATTGEGIFEGLVCSHTFSWNTEHSTNMFQAWLSNNVKLPAGSK
jgi:ADP-ribosylation factor protein 6